MNKCIYDVAVLRGEKYESIATATHASAALLFACMCEIAKDPGEGITEVILEVAGGIEESVKFN